MADLPQLPFRRRLAIVLQSHLPGLALLAAWVWLTCRPGTRFSWWMLCLLVGSQLASLIGWARLAVETNRLRRRAAAGACLQCGYDLTGNASGVCPECGTPAGRLPG